jgi:transcription elongation GreA/GreB family factor
MNSENNQCVIDVGCTVNLVVNGKAQSWQIVREGHSDPRNGRISINAPLVRLIAGKKAPCEVSANLLGRQVKVFLVNVKPNPPSQDQ